ncbi:MAG: hypothetical protein ACRD68_08255 [Pyrinomonadaceae bacterium]
MPEDRVEGFLGQVKSANKEAAKKEAFKESSKSHSSEVSNTMLQTVEAVIDREGRVRLLEKVSLAQTRHALVTILEEVRDESETAHSPQNVSDSIVGSVELLTDDLEADSKEISRMLGDALLRSGENLSR